MNRICPRCRGVIVASYYPGGPSCLQCGYAGGGRVPTPEMMAEVCGGVLKRAEEPKHGQINTYKRGCRCVPCRGANNAANARYRAARAG